MSADKQSVVDGRKFLRITDPAQAESCTVKVFVFSTHRENTVFLFDKLCPHIRQRKKFIHARRVEAYFPTRLLYVLVTVDSDCADTLFLLAVRTDKKQKLLTSAANRLLVGR